MSLDILSKFRGESNVYKNAILKHFTIRTMVLGSAALVSVESLLEMQKLMPYSRLLILELHLNKVPSLRSNALIDYTEMLGPAKLKRRSMKPILA